MLPACASKPSASPETRDTAIALPATQTPLPPFLEDVYPKPGSQVSQTAYATGTGVEEPLPFYWSSGKICADLNQKNLLEQNDYDLNSYNYVERGHLKVSTFGPNPRSVPVRNDLVWSPMAGGATFDERGNSIGGSLAVCWEVDLKPSVYEATYEYTQTSGHVLSYTWSFEITE
jgi:hypothetical protein